MTAPNATQIKAANPVEDVAPDYGIAFDPKSSRGYRCLGHYNHGMAQRRRDLLSQFGQLGWRWNRDLSQLLERVDEALTELGHAAAGLSELSPRLFGGDI